VRFEEAFRDELAQLDKEAGIRSLGRNALLATALAFSGHGGKHDPQFSTPTAASWKETQEKLHNRDMKAKEERWRQKDRIDALDEASIRRRLTYYDTPDSFDHIAKRRLKRLAKPIPRGDTEGVGNTSESTSVGYRK